MKYSDLNAKQKKAVRNIINASNYYIGGYEIILEDFPEDSQEYKNAKEILANHEGLKSEIYFMAITNVYEGGCEYHNAGAESFLKDVRFCGKDWLMQRVENRLVKMGY